MKLYAISGLGADHRVFECLSLNHELEAVSWLDPISDESLDAYCGRLAEKIDTSQPFGLIGVSFGGMVVVELNKILSPEFSILISSCATRDEIPVIYRMAGTLGILKVIPRAFFNPPKAIAHWLFGAKNKRLLSDILDDTDPRFAKWAAQKIVTWTSSQKTPNLIRIHGTKDWILPMPKNSNAIEIKQGTHFMIVDRAEEISTIVNGNTPQQRI